jgi:MFS family permease
MTEVAALSRAGRTLVLASAFFGWLFAGVPMAITPLASRTAAGDLLRRVPLEFETGRFRFAALLAAPAWPSSAPSVTPQFREVPERELGRWFAWFNSAFLLGAAAGGLLFGWVGDRFGRTKALALSILTYSSLSAVGYFAGSVEQLLVLRFLACLGIGGTWPNGIALASEAWSHLSRLTVAGIIGTAVNVGIVLLGILATQVHITEDSWRWVMLVAAAPLPLGLLVWACVPESPNWLAARGQSEHKPRVPVAEVFWPPLLSVTVIGILLGTIPLLGGWGSANWLVPWADQVGGKADAVSKAWTLVSRSTGGTISSLLGGWLAGLMGRKASYFAISLASLAVSAYIFHYLTPAAAGEATPWDYFQGLIGSADAVSLGAVNWFNAWAFMLGVVAGFYFGWLPLCLPELFPTRVRSTGAGVTFNFGRIAAAVGVLFAGELVNKVFNGSYAQVGSYTSLIYVLGMIVIWFAPQPAAKDLK